jgi:hypothetical protein
MLTQQSLGFPTKCLQDFYNLFILLVCGFVHLHTAILAQYLLPLFTDKKKVVELLHITKFVGEFFI